jgi:hypothetical protein
MSVLDALIARFFDSCRTVRPQAWVAFRFAISVERTLERGVCVREPKFTLILPSVRGPLPSGLSHGIPSTLIIYNRRTAASFLRNFPNFAGTPFVRGPRYVLEPGPIIGAHGDGFDRLKEASQDVKNLAERAAGTNTPG